MTKLSKEDREKINEFVRTDENYSDEIISEAVMGNTEQVIFGLVLGLIICVAGKVLGSILY